VHEPLPGRRIDPVDPRRSARRDEASLRRAAGRLGLERPAVVMANRLLAGFGSFGWAGPVTFYAWDDWTPTSTGPGRFGELLTVALSGLRGLGPGAPEAHAVFGASGPRAVVALPPRARERGGEC
jgi:hypothetical protein